MGWEHRHLYVPDVWQDYWSKYPEGYTVLESLLDWVSQVNNLVDEVNTWDKYFNDFAKRFDERLQPEIKKTLAAIVEAGTFEDLIGGYPKDLKDLKNKVSYMNSLRMDSRPVYHTTMESFQQSVTQGFIVKDDGTIYNIQADITNKPDNERHATVNRLTPGGLLIDYMEVIHSGHGADWKLISEGECDYFIFYAVVNGSGSFVKMPYVPYGRVDVFADKRTKFVPTYGSDAQVIGIDQANDRLAIANLGSITAGAKERGKVKVYAYEAYMNSVDYPPTPKHVVPVENDVFQGIDIKNNKLFLYYGADAKAKASDAHIVVHDLTTGDKESHRLYDLGQSPVSTEHNTTEPEGVFVWQHPHSGELSVFICMAAGRAGLSKRTRKLYGWHEGNNSDFFRNIVQEKNDGGKFADGDGSALALDTFPDKLSEITTYGSYYFRGVDMEHFTDLPKDITGSGHFLFNLPKSKSGSFIQVLERNTGTDSLAQYKRVVLSRSKEATDWTQTQGGKLVIVPDMPESKRLSDIKNTTEFYLTGEMWRELIDTPDEKDINGISGFWVQNSAHTGDGSFYQRCIRNTSSLNVLELVRIIQPVSNYVGDWFVNNYEKVGGVE